MNVFGVVSKNKINEVIEAEIHQLEELSRDSYLWTDLTKEERDRVQIECEQRISLLKKVKKKIFE